MSPQNGRSVVPNCSVVPMGKSPPPLGVSFPPLHRSRPQWPGALAPTFDVAPVETPTGNCWSQPWSGGGLPKKKIPTKYADDMSIVFLNSNALFLSFLLGFLGYTFYKETVTTPNRTPDFSEP